MVFGWWGWQQFSNGGDLWTLKACNVPSGRSFRLLRSLSPLNSTAHGREVIMTREELAWHQGRATSSGETQFSGPLRATWLPLHRHLDDVTHTHVHTRTYTLYYHLVHICTLPVANFIQIDRVTNLYDVTVMCTDLLCKLVTAFCL